jgi:hypothetical protein
LGENTQPKTKIDGFARALRTWSGDKPQVAALKLCFVDVTDSTNVTELLRYYADTMRQLKAEFPSVVFGHATVPLATESDSLKAKVKRLIGRRISEDAANAVRTQYNRALREMFPNDPILDLERVESMRANGTRVAVTIDGAEAYGLAAEYASDPWGHLNESGARLAAAELARFVVDAASRKPATN